MRGKAKQLIAHRAKREGCDVFRAIELATRMGERIVFSVCISKDYLKIAGPLAPFV